MINQMRRGIRERRPLIHCITNPISINQCANALLAVGARPVMAEHPREVAEITRTAQALMLNLGNITDARLQSIAIAAKTADEQGVPFVIDAVGIACSALRREFVCELLQGAAPTLIKGNYSEVWALYSCEYRASGVDADSNLDIGAVSKAAVELSRKYNSIILASGETDIVTDGKRLFCIKNGIPQLATITGTGCILGALCACCLSVVRDISAVTAACALLGICGELSVTDKGSGSFAVNLMDRLSTLSEEDAEEYLDMEEAKIEDI